MVDISDLQRITPWQFESLVQAVFSRLGYEVELTARTGDQGVDLVLVRDGERSVAQCKRYRAQVGQPIVREFYGATKHEQARRGYLVTTGTFSLPAQTWAHGKNLVLVDGVDLVDILTDLQIQVDSPAQKEAPFVSIANVLSGLNGRRVFIVLVGPPSKGHDFQEVAQAAASNLGIELRSVDSFGAILSARGGDLLFWDAPDADGLRTLANVMVFGCGKPDEPRFFNAMCSFYSTEQEQKSQKKLDAKLRWRLDTTDSFKLIRIEASHIDWTNLPERERDA